MLAESAACSAVVLFGFACLIRHNGNTKGKKTIFLKEKLSILRYVYRHLFCGKTTWIISITSECDNQKPSCRSVWISDYFLINK
jgi:hypothetical protein